MMDLDPVRMIELEKQMEPLCISKAEEFQLIGYENITSQEVWECIMSNYRKELPPVHRIVNDILSLKVTRFMNWLTMKVYKGEFD